MHSEIFVFGSNLAGRHGAGAAYAAFKSYGAIQGQGEGLQGKSYAIPTKDGTDGGSLHRPNQILSLRAIKKSVDDFIAYARKHPELTFKVTPIGTGLSGYKHDDIAPMFALVPENCIMPAKWYEHLKYNEKLKYWNC